MAEETAEKKGSLLVPAISVGAVLVFPLTVFLLFLGSGSALGRSTINPQSNAVQAQQLFRLEAANNPDAFVTKNISATLTALKDEVSRIERKISATTLTDAQRTLLTEKLTAVRAALTELEVSSSDSTKVGEKAKVLRDAITAFNTAGVISSPLSTSKLGVPLLKQGSYGDVNFGQSAVSRSGCSATSFTMVAQWLGTPANVPDVAAFAVASGFRNGESGVPQEFFVKGAEKYGLKAEVLFFRQPGARTQEHWQQIKDRLAQGTPVIVAGIISDGTHTGPRYAFSKGGHYVVATGFDEARSVVMINDPAVPNRPADYEIPLNKFVPYVQSAIILTK
jgi:hypothetical protein